MKLPATALYFPSIQTCEPDSDLSELEPDIPNNYNLLKFVFQSVLVVTQKDDQFVDHGIPSIGHNLPEANSIVNIYHGLKFCETDYAFVYGGNVKNISIPLIHKLWSMSDNCDAVIPRKHSGEDEPLFAFYHIRTLPVFKSNVENSEILLSQMLKLIKVRFHQLMENQRLD